MSYRGARYLHVLVPCPLGWGTRSDETIKLARLATESGLFPVYEAENGVVTSTKKIRRHVPVDEYLKAQKRFAHLFGAKGRSDFLEAIQAIADRNIAEFDLLDEKEEM
jgi:pyruvate ferredoxin oxidoreductase beta subunit